MELNQTNDSITYRNEDGTIISSKIHNGKIKILCMDSESESVVVSFNSIKEFEEWSKIIIENLAIK